MRGHDFSKTLNTKVDKFNFKRKVELKRLKKQAIKQFNKLTYAIRTLPRLPAP